MIGTTLPELMVVVAMVVVISTLAVGIYGRGGCG